MSLCIYFYRQFCLSNMPPRGLGGPRAAEGIGGAQGKYNKWDPEIRIV